MPKLSLIFHCIFIYKSMLPDTKKNFLFYFYYIRKNNHKLPKTARWPYLLDSYELMNLGQQYTVHLLQYMRFSANSFSSKSS